MRTLSLSPPPPNVSCQVVLYQSIFELPADEHAAFQRYLLQDAHIGSTLADVQAHFAKLDQLLADGRTEEAADERALLHYNLQFMLDGFSPASLAFGCLVYAVDQVLVTDRTEEGLLALLSRLSQAGLTAGLVQELLSDVKKKLRAELKQYFPARFDTEGEQLLHFQQERKRALALADYVLSGEARHLETVRQVNRWLLDEARPLIFDDGDPRNELLAQRRAHARLCATLRDQGVPEPGRLSLFDYHTQVEYLREKHARA